MSLKNNRLEFKEIQACCRKLNLATATIYKGKIENLESCFYFFDSENAVWIEKTSRKTSDVSFALSSEETFNTVYFFAPLKYSIKDNKIEVKEEPSKHNFFKTCDSKIES